MKFDRNNKYVAAGVTALLVIAGGLLFYMLLTRWTDVRETFMRIAIRPLSPIFIGMGVAYLLTPIMNYIEQRLIKTLMKRLFPKREQTAIKLSRGISVFASIMLLVAFTAGLFILVIPELIASAEKLIVNSNMYLESARKWVNNFFNYDQGLETTADTMVTYIVGQATAWLEGSIIPLADSLFANISSGVMSFVFTLVNIFIGIVVSSYLMYSKELFQNQTTNLLKAVLPQKFLKSLLEMVREAHRLFGRFLLGKVLASLIVGSICAIFMTVTQMPYAALISVLVAVTNVIPFVGPFIGAIPSAFLLLLESPVRCLIFVIFILVLQQIDGNFISAKIVGNSTGLSGFWVIVAVFVSGALFDFAGMVLGVPIFALVYHQIRLLISRRLAKLSSLEDGPNISNINDIGIITEKNEK